jgi:polar amino acid transport system substrate-binding protein
MLKKDGVDNEKFRVATLKGSTSQYVVERAAPKARLTLTGSYDEALKLLFEDKVDAVIADYPYCAFVVARYPDKGLALGESKLSFEPLGIAVREDALLMNGLENFVKMLMASGDMNLLHEKWFKSGAWIKQLR